MKSVMISIQPYWVFLIIAKVMGWNIGKEKTVEVRKNYPKAEKWNKVVKIYCSKDKKSFAKIPVEYQPLMERFLGKVIGEFVCDKIYKRSPHSLIVKEDRERATAGSCLTAQEIRDYVRGNRVTYNLADLPDFYCWHISNLVVYDEPKPLSNYLRCPYPWECEACDLFDGFDMSCNRKIRPPQSWCYVEG